MVVVVVDKVVLDVMVVRYLRYRLLCDDPTFTSMQIWYFILHSETSVKFHSSSLRD